MAAIFNDGAVQYGSRVLAITDSAGANSVNYIASNIEVNRPAKIIERVTEIGEPSGQVAVAAFVNGRATIQLASGSTAIPLPGYKFTATFVATSPGAENFQISETGQPEDQNGEKKINITFRKLYN